MKKGWEIKRLDDVCEVVYGTRVVNKRDGGTIYPVYGGGGATFFMDTYNRENCFIVARFAMSEQCTRFVSGKFFLNDSGLSVKPINTKEILQDFLNLQLLYLNDHIYSLARGTAQKNLDVPAFRNIELNYPKSLTEQQRIVSILNEAFAAIDKAKANAERNLENAKELFESYLESIFKNKGDGWKEKKLGEVCLIKGRIGYRGYTKQDMVKKGEGAITLSPSNINDDKMQFDNLVYISWYKYNESPEIKIYNGDILFVKTGSSYGKTALVEELPEKATINPQFVVFKKISCLNKYLYYVLRNPKFKKQVDSIVGGTAIPTLSQANLAELIIFEPSLTIQHIIVQKLDAISAKCKKLEIIYKKKIEKLEEMKKSILQKAFHGELKTIL